MNDETPSVEPVELSPTRAELIARVRSRGLQIRARRRLAVAGVAALALIAIAAPAIAIGSRSTSRSVTPATVAHGKGDFRIALVTHVQDASGHFGDPCIGSFDGKSCYVLGRTLVTARDVRSDSVLYDTTAGWDVIVELSPAGVLRLAEPIGQTVAVIVAGRVVSAPVIRPGITGTSVAVASTGLTREQAIALATKITGRAPAHVDPAPATLSSHIELPATTFAAGPEIHGILEFDNPTSHPITLEHKDECHGKWAATLTNANFPRGVFFTQECSGQRTVIAPGVTRFPFDIITTYPGCGGGGSPAHRVQPCLPDNAGAPPLPAGDYQAVVVDTFDKNEFPTPPALGIHLTAGAPTTGSEAGLSVQTGAYGIKALVPSSGWRYGSEDRGHRASTTTWNKMSNPRQQITINTGVRTADWWETDGGAGSINPAKVLYSKAQIQRVNYTTFLIHIDDPADGSIDGVWMAEIVKGVPIAYVEFEVRLPLADHALATTIINRFIGDTDTMFSNGKL